MSKEAEDPLKLDDELADVMQATILLADRLRKLPGSRSISLAITKLEEANLWLMNRTMKGI